ncbi:MAG TPA: condensation domain-containing protein, partial [Hymenobacter sp.]
VGYVVAEGSLDKEGVLAQLRAKLPDYMVPALLVEIPEVPLTPNGKIDRKALPEPNVTELRSNAYQAPRNETEATLVQIWQELLHLEQVGVNDNFFELGGHSLLAIQLVSAIRQSLRVEVPIKTIFTYPTIAGLAGHLLPNESGVMLLPILPGNRTGKLPLSFAQERLWFIDQLQGSTHYHLPAVLRLVGELDVQALSQSFGRLVERHEVLRTVIRQVDGQAYQQILPADWRLDYRADTSPADEETLKGLVQAIIEQPFDLSRDSVLRAVLMRLSDEEYLLVVVLHHIAGDGWSVSVLVKELLEVYEATLEKRPPVLPALPVQYGDYALWQRQYLQGEVLAKELSYWKKQLAGLESLELPTDFARPPVQSTDGGMQHLELGPQLRRKLEAFSQQEGVTPFMTLLAVFKVLLSRYCGQEDICVGTAVAGRLQAEVEPLVGFFVNTLALRSNLSGNPGFRQLLQLVRATVLEAFSHQQLPFEKVVEAVGTTRDLSRSPVFQVAFALQNTPDVPELHLEKVRLEGESFETNTAKFDLTLTATPAGRDMEVSVNYCR